MLRPSTLQVCEIEKGTSAWQSPLNIGDRVAMIDGVPVRGKSQRQLAADLLGPDGTSVELRVEHENSSETGIGLCGGRRNPLKVIRLVRGSPGTVEEEEEDDVLQVRVDETQNCSGSMSLGILCMPTGKIF
jgi:C-terminal processing protease CtpA/Prc